MVIRRVIERCFRGTLLHPNSILDKVCESETFENLRALEGVQLKSFPIPRAAYISWVQHYVPRWRLSFRNCFHKKLIEFYVSFSLLEIGKEDVYMDAAGGLTSHIERVACKERIVQDIKGSSEAQKRFVGGVKFIESNAGQIPMADGSVDKISVHHSFEHFQGTSDMEFVREIQRLLSVRGKCCIIPLFMGNRYVEVTDRVTLERRSDDRALYLIDPSATLPGGEFSGSYARIYDIAAFRERVLKQLDQTRFQVTIYQVTDESSVPLPDMKLRVHKAVAKINYPYRALLIERKASPR